MPGGELEYAVLAALWELGTASVPELYAKVGQPRSLVYTTIAKVIDRLHEKGLVSRRRQGILFVYRPKVERTTVDNARAAAALHTLFADAPRPAIATLVSAVEAIDPSLLDELARVIAQRRRTRQGR